MYHDPCHSPMKQHAPLKVSHTGQCAAERRVDKNDRCCGESGTLAISRPDVSTQVRFRKEQKCVVVLSASRDPGAVGGGPQRHSMVTSRCSPPAVLPAGLVALSGRHRRAADYIVVELARHLLGPDWMQQYVTHANDGGIERVLV